LRVADNSIMPAPVSGNTQAAAYVIGAKAAALILAEAAGMDTAASRPITGPVHV